ncbi:MAG: hypothetical protein DI598_14365 [Pseudopedobacter saltans]|uniref:Uncharacterized protein n=1 Tax=Pseudopedobacter saltans TaxID=151895 RepID=A0A2W5GR73_9SPHI|nr:MAG: hypothetical protein DI598_14365 [Pseudopedobacter saltans]
MILKAYVRSIVASIQLQSSLLQTKKNVVFCKICVPKNVFVLENTDLFNIKKNYNYVFFVKLEYFSGFKY